MTPATCGVRTRFANAGEFRRRRLGQGFGLEHVERRAAQLAFPEGVSQCRFVDNATARGVDQDRAGLHGRDGVTAHEVSGAGCQRHMQAHHVAGSEQILQFELCSTRFWNVGGDIGVVEPDLHAESGCEPRRVTGDRAETDQAEHLAADLATGACLAWPLPGKHRRIGEPCAAQQHHGRRHHIFGHRDIVRAVGRIDRDATPLAVFDIDVVKADAEPADTSQVGGGIEQGFGDLRAIANDQGIDARHHGGQVVLPVGERRVVDDIE